MSKLMTDGIYSESERGRADANEGTAKAARWKHFDRALNLLFTACLVFITAIQARLLGYANQDTAKAADAASKSAEIADQALKEGRDSSQKSYGLALNAAQAAKEQADTAVRTLQATQDFERRSYSLASVAAHDETKAAEAASSNARTAAAEFSLNQKVNQGLPVCLGLSGAGLVGSPQISTFEFVVENGGRLPINIKSWRLQLAYCGLNGVPKNWTGPIAPVTPNLVQLDPIGETRVQFARDWWEAKGQPSTSTSYHAKLLVDYLASGHRQTAVLGQWVWKNGKPGWYLEPVSN